MSSLKHSEINLNYKRVEAEHDMVLSHITLKAYMNPTTYEHVGWILPGGKIIKNKITAQGLAKQWNNSYD